MESFGIYASTVSHYDGGFAMSYGVESKLLVSLIGLSILNRGEVNQRGASEGRLGTTCSR